MNIRQLTTAEVADYMGVRHIRPNDDWVKSHQRAYEEGVADTLITPAPDNTEVVQGQLKMLLTLSAKQNPMAYMEPYDWTGFQPHGWVIDAVNRAYHLGELRATRAVAVKKPSLLERFTELLTEAEAEGVILTTMVHGAKFKGQFSHKAIAEQVPEKPAEKWATLGNYQYPQPCTKMPAPGTPVFVVYPDNVYERTRVDGDSVDKFLVDGRVHLVKEHAKQHQEALRKALRDASREAK